MICRAASSGSYGTLAAYTELTIKVLPRPETAQTLLILGLDDAGAAKAMSAAVGSYYDVSGAAHLPADIAARVPAVAGAGQAVTALRLEGVPPSIRHRREKLEALLGPFGALSALEAEASELFWMAVRDVLPFADGVTKRRLARLDRADAGCRHRRRARATSAARAFYDWAGGLVWIEMPDAEPRAELIRAAVRASGGHATLDPRQRRPRALPPRCSSRSTPSPARWCAG